MVQLLTVAETRLLSLLGGESFDRLEIEVIVQMQVVEVFAVNQEVEHVVALAAHLEPSFHPIQRCRLEELGRFERPEQISITVFYNYYLFKKEVK